MTARPLHGSPGDRNVARVASGADPGPLPACHSANPDNTTSPALPGHHLKGQTP
jgi:hypothetical protein